MKDNLDKIEQGVKIALTAAVIGTGCAIAVEELISRIKMRKSLSDIVSSMRPYSIKQEYKSALLVELLKIGRSRWL